MVLTQRQGDLCVGSCGCSGPVLVGTTGQRIEDGVGNGSGGGEVATSSSADCAIRGQLQSHNRSHTQKVLQAAGKGSCMMHLSTRSQCGAELLPPAVPEVPGRTQCVRREVLEAVAVLEAQCSWWWPQLHSLRRQLCKHHGACFDTTE